MATVSSVPTDLSSVLANVVSEMQDCALTPLVLVPFCRRVTLECRIGEHGWLITVIADYWDTTTSDGTSTRDRRYTWEAGACPSDPRDVVDFEEMARYVFDTPAEALADATQFVAEHRAVPEAISVEVG
jgi:hypothetical protein